MKRPRWAFFISGRGSNLQAALDLKDEIDVGLVVSSRAGAQGLGRARREGLPTLVLDKKVDWDRLTDELRAYNVSHIFLLGFMKILPAEFIKNWQGTIINLHPSLLPAYPGLKSIERAYQDGVDMGVTVHHVVAEVDAGEILLQKRVVTSEELRDKSLTLDQAEFSIHRTENSMVREALRNWI